MPYPFRTGAELLRTLPRAGLPIAQVMLANETGVAHRARRCGAGLLHDLGR